MKYTQNCIWRNTMDKNNDFIKKVYFSELNLNDHFFDSLRDDYIEFDEWFKKM